jgi:hypothetical protein
MHRRPGAGARLPGDHLPSRGRCFPDSDGSRAEWGLLACILSSHAGKPFGGHGRPVDQKTGQSEDPSDLDIGLAHLLLPGHPTEQGSPRKRRARPVPSSPLRKLRGA